MSETAGQSPMSTEAIGAAFAHAIAIKDRQGLSALLAENIEFRALTPGRTWTADDASTVVDEIVFGRWFEPTDTIEALESVECGSVGDRNRVGYRLRIASGGELHICEQQAYYEVQDDRITGSG
jgi:hypothetical protein